MNKAEQTLQRLSDGVALNNVMTSDMYEVFKTARAGFKIIKFFGDVAKPLLFVGLAFGLLGATMRENFRELWNYLMK